MPGTTRFLCVILLFILVWFCVAQFQFAFLSMFIIAYLLCFSVICVSCSKLHKIKLDENMAWMQGQQAQGSNELEDESSR